MAFAISLPLVEDMTKALGISSRAIATSCLQNVDRRGNLNARHHMPSVGWATRLQLRDVDPSPLGRGQVRIRIKAAGVSFAATLVIAGKYQRKPPLPFAPGTEASGVVTEVDPACRRIKVSDEVVAVLDWGGLAEEVVAHEVNVFPKPRNVGFVEAVQLAIS